MLQRLVERGFQIDFRSHAKAILSGDFPDVAAELEEVLLASTLPIEEIIGSGGGETKGTQRLRNALGAKGWRKHNFVVKRTIDGVEKEAQSHEVDHVREFIHPRRDRPHHHEVRGKWHEQFVRVWFLA